MRKLAELNYKGEKTILFKKDGLFYVYIILKSGVTIKNEKLSESSAFYLFDLILKESGI